MWPNPQETADLVTFTEEILNEKLHFLCSVRIAFYICANTYHDVTAIEVDVQNSSKYKTFNI